MVATDRGAERGGVPGEPFARDRLARLWRMKIRYLGDAVLRRVAWEVADQLDLASTYDAQYVALTRQADALVTLDPQLARKAEGVVPIARISALGSASAGHEPKPK